METKEKRRTIIAVCGESNIGKTAAICTVYEKLTGEKMDDERKVINYKTKKIGITNVGDPDSDQPSYLEDFANGECQIIICACRPRNPTKGNVLEIAGYGYDVIWTSNFSSQEAAATGGIMPGGVDLNDEFATAIEHLINKL
jgi:hypothetical protein